MKISFDFDLTLSLTKIQKIADALIKTGEHELFIITKRDLYSYDDINDVAEKLGITNIFYCNGKLKYQAIDNLKIDMHFDDDDIEIQAIRKHLNIICFMLYDDFSYQRSKSGLYVAEIER